MVPAVARPGYSRHIHRPRALVPPRFSSAFLLVAGLNPAVLGVYTLSATDYGSCGAMEAWLRVAGWSLDAPCRTFLMGR